METSYFTILATLIAAIANAFGGYYFKKGSFSYLNKFIFLGIFFYGLSTLISVPALRFGELSILYPLIATAYIWTTILGVKYMGEEMCLLKGFGMAFIVLGVIIISLGA